MKLVIDDKEMVGTYYKDYYRPLYRTIRKHIETFPKVLLETGTGWMANCLAAHDFFDEVHSVELSDRLYSVNTKMLPDLIKYACFEDKIRLYHGDSKDWVPEMSEKFQCPVMWYLDAHHDKTNCWSVLDVFPLWDELQAISKRPFADILVIDDTQCFDGEGEWKGVTRERIAEVVDKEAVGFEFDTRLILALAPNPACVA